MAGFLFILRCKRDIPEDIDHRRSGMPCRLFLIGDKSLLQTFQPAVHQMPVHDQRQIFFMVIVVLLVRICSEKAVFLYAPAEEQAVTCTVNGTFQPHLFKVFNGFFHHTLKAQRITDIGRFLFGQILAGIHKSDTVAFRISVRHQIDPLLRQFCQIRCKSDLILRDVFAETVQISRILKIRIYDQVMRKAAVCIYDLRHPPFALGLIIIADKIIQRIL